jgi:putative addiction module component (TIGR02574 family)
MSASVESLLEQAKALPEADREELARRLYDTLPPLPEMPAAWDSEEEAESAWQEELGHRLASIADGTGELIDGEQVFAELRARHRQRRDRGQ